MGIWRLVHRWSTVTRTLDVARTPPFPQGWRRKLCVVLTPPRRQSITIDSYQSHGRLFRNIPVQPSVFPLVSHRRHHLATHIRSRCPRSTCNIERCLPTAFARSRKTRSPYYCGRMPFVLPLKLGSDDCRSSDVTRVIGSPNIGCSPSDSMDASDGNTEGFSDYLKWALIS